MKVVVIIPALNPDNKLINLVKKLKDDFNKIIIVDDGCKKKDVFNHLSQYNECIILHHSKNKGKGMALKTAFNYFLDNYSNDYLGVITVDADGQHLPSDVLDLSLQLEKEKKFILGTRLFDTKETPFRNKLGNRLTSFVFKKLYGIYIRDTQTGLRAIPNDILKEIKNIQGKRFEYEINVLIALVREKKEIIQTNIKTVYLKESNKKSNFRVFSDSIKIYQILWKNRKNK